MFLVTTIAQEGWVGSRHYGARMQLGRRAAFSCRLRGKTAARNPQEKFH